MKSGGLQETSVVWEVLRVLGGDNVQLGRKKSVAIPHSKAGIPSRMKTYLVS